MFKGGKCSGDKLKRKIAGSYRHVKVADLKSMVRGDLAEEVAFNQDRKELGAVLSGAG